jgi:hypothetical protein
MAEGPVRRVSFLQWSSYANAVETWERLKKTSQFQVIAIYERIESRSRRFAVRIVSLAAPARLFGIYWKKWYFGIMQSPLK